MPDENTYGFNLVDAGRLLESIGGYESEIPDYRPLSSTSSIKYAYPPSGGIPASTYDAGTKKMVPGTASCTLAELVDGEYCDTGDNVIVENPVGAVVGSSGKPMTIGHNSYGKWTVLVEDCTGDAAPVEPTAMTPDPGESSGSRALDPGYKMGV